MTAAQLFCKYVNLTLMLTDSLYWLGMYQIELDGLHDWSMCSLILQVVRCDVSGVYLIWVSGGYWLTAVNISQHNLNHLPHTSVVDSWLENIYLHQQTKKGSVNISHFQRINIKWQKMIQIHLIIMSHVLLEKHVGLDHMNATSLYKNSKKLFQILQCNVTLKHHWLFTNI